MLRPIFLTLVKGDFYFARYDSFDNEAFSPRGYGKTPLAAVTALQRAEADQPRIEAKNDRWHLLHTLGWQDMDQLFDHLEAER